MNIEPEPPCSVCGAEWMMSPAGRWTINHLSERHGKLKPDSAYDVEPPRRIGPERVGSILDDLPVTELRAPREPGE